MDEDGKRTKGKKQLKRWEIIVNMKTEQNGRKEGKERENRNREREINLRTEDGEGNIFQRDWQGKITEENKRQKEEREESK